LGFVLVMLFAPRMEEARILFGIRFATKAGTPGLTDLGWALMVLVPPAVYFMMGVIIDLVLKKRDGAGDAGGTG